MKPNRTLYRIAPAVAALTLGAALLAPPAYAQESSTKKKEAQQLIPPAPPMGKSDTPWTPYGAAILVLLVVVGVNLIPSKRGHQD